MNRFFKSISKLWTSDWSPVLMAIVMIVVCLTIVIFNK